MTSVRRPLALAGVLLCSASIANAQSWQTLEVSRQLRDTTAHGMRIKYGAGHLAIRVTDQPLLYMMKLRYDEQEGQPVHRYSAAQRSVTLGVSNQSVHWNRGGDDRSGNDLQIGLSRVVPLDLEVDVGAALADLDLTGVPLREAQIRTGAAAATISFDAPNPVPLRTFDVKVGAAGVTATGLANANASNIQMKSGVGKLDLDFTGKWVQDITLDVKVAMGRVDVHVPSDVGVRVDVKRVLASFSHDGLRKRGDSYFSDNWDTARYKLHIRGETAFGAFAIDRRERLASR